MQTDCPGGIKSSGYSMPEHRHRLRNKLTGMAVNHIFLFSQGCGPTQGCIFIPTNQKDKIEVSQNLRNLLGSVRISEVPLERFAAQLVQVERMSPETAKEAAEEAMCEWADLVNHPDWQKFNFNQGYLDV
jgi:hypothetical protein